MGIIFGSRTTQPGGSHCAANIVEGVTPGCSDPLKAASTTPPPPPSPSPWAHALVLCNSQAVVDSWRLSRSPFLPSRRSSHSGGQYKLRGYHVAPAIASRAPHAPSPPHDVNKKITRHNEEGSAVAATDRHQQGGSGDQHHFRLSAALMAKWDGIILEGTDWRPSTCREDRPVKSSSVPAERRGVY